MSNPLRYLCCATAGATLLALGAPAAPLAAENQAHETLLAAARTFLESRATPGRGETVIELAPLDPRLQLAACSAPLEAFANSATPEVGNVTVAVRCPGTVPWTVYLRGTAHLYVKVAVLRKALAKDAALGEADVEFVRKDAAELRGGYFLDPAHILNHQVKRPLPAGTVLTPGVLAAPRLVRRGQQVTIRSGSAALTVQMSGEALTDGQEGQRIHVRNTRSRRVVEGRVVAPGVVEIVH